MMKTLTKTSLESRRSGEEERPPQARKTRSPPPQQGSTQDHRIRCRHVVVIDRLVGRVVVEGYVHV